MTRILHVLTSPRAEGTPRLVLDWLSERGCEQGVLFLTPEPAQLNEAFHRACRWVRFGRPFGRVPFKYAQIVSLTRRSVREFKPDVVVAWPAGWSHWVHVGSRLGGNPRLLTHAGTAPGRGIFRRHLYTWFSFGLGRLCGHRVIACSQYVRAAYTALPFLTEGHVRFSYNCCQVSRFVRPSSAAPAERTRACMVGSLELSKDYPNLLRAWQLVERAGDHELCIAGGGSQRDALAALTLSLGLKHVRFLGAIDDVPSLLWSSGVFVLSANPEEGFGTVLIEALAAGCSVIATDVPACREVLQDGRYGRLVPPGDPVALAGALLEHLGRPAPEAEIVGGVEYARSFTAARMIERYLQIAFAPNAAPLLSASQPVPAGKGGGHA